MIERTVEDLEVENAEQRERIEVLEEQVRRMLAGGYKDPREAPEAEGYIYPPPQASSGEVYAMTPRLAHMNIGGPPGTTSLPGLVFR
jgi:hypothetical protein